jgi:hypothetical protein
VTTLIVVGLKKNQSNFRSKKLKNIIYAPVPNHKRRPIATAATVKRADYGY